MLDFEDSICRVMMIVRVDYGFVVLCVLKLLIKMVIL